MCSTGIPGGLALGILSGYPGGLTAILMDKPITLLSVLGRRLDAGLSGRRWQRWRPSVAALQQPDLPVARYHLLELPGEAELGQQVAADLLELQPKLDLRRHPLPIQDAWNFEQVYGALHDLARALAIDPSRERLLVNVTTGTHVMQICLFLLVEARYLPGELLQLSPPTKQGRPGSWSSVDLDLARYDQLAQRFRREAQQGSSLLKDGIHTRNANFNQLIDQLERIAGHSRDPILLEGATGVGKTQLAKRLVELKRQRGQLAGRFVELNCATLRGDGAMSALFGHVRGAFTGAEKAREGLLRAAHGGLLFLDEIGELGLDEQAMLLRALEEGRFLPVGADQEVQSDFQLVAGTNRDLNAAVLAGRLREDLLARIDQWRFRLPSLFERREDIEPNLDWSLERWCERHGQAVRFNQEGRRAYLEFALASTSTW
jgi:transcriptional regulatory protein RtcR